MWKVVSLASWVSFLVLYVVLAFSSRLHKYCFVLLDLGNCLISSHFPLTVLKPSSFWKPIISCQHSRIFSKSQLSNKSTELFVFLLFECISGSSCGNEILARALADFESMFSLNFCEDVPPLIRGSCLGTGTDCSWSGPQ